MCRNAARQAGLISHGRVERLSAWAFADQEHARLPGKGGVSRYDRCAQTWRCMKSLLGTGLFVPSARPKCALSFAKLEASSPCLGLQDSRDHALNFAQPPDAGFVKCLAGCMPHLWVDSLLELVHGFA